LSATTKFYVRPGENERIETAVRLDPEARSTIHGTVRDKDGRPLEDAAVLLFVTGNHPDELRLFSQTFTDDNGQFFFGPLEPGRLYLVKLFQNAVKTRELELVAE
jgi:protocatechuate 3,4-dioxygenase beta subunit